MIELVHNWRFVQTAAVDPKARAEVYDTETMGPMLRYVIAHEVGHTLGLMHNMRGSYAYPVDSPALAFIYGEIRHDGLDYGLCPQQLRRSTG